jgi:hypothetical protein
MLVKFNKEHLMTQRAQILSIISVVYFWVCAVDVLAQEPMGLTEAFKQHLMLKKDEPVPKYQYALTDLDNDGQNDAVILITDNDYCGSGGCNLLIFHRTQKGFTFVSESTICKSPIRIMDHLSYGWKSIIVYTGGTGDVVLRFNGKKYPSNPSMQSKATKQQLESAKILIK